MNKEYPIITSYFTQNWEYPFYAKRLQQDCERLGLQHHIVEIPDTGKWILNTGLKPKFIKELLLEINYPVLWLDVDGSLIKLPSLLKLPNDYDLAFRPKPEHHNRKWHVGTMYFAPTSRTFAFLDDWIIINEKLQDSDEYALDQLWRENPISLNNLKIFELPPEYFQMLNTEHPDPLRNSIIVHRASKGKSKKEYMDEYRKNPF